MVALASYLDGYVVDGGVVGRREQRNPVVVRVFRDEKEIAAHRIGSLLRANQARASISHVQWLERVPMTFTSPLVLETLGGRRALQPETGALSAPETR